MTESKKIPRATYRLQFRNGFGFEDAARIIPYLARLGISHLYASPIFQAREGSTHGYDAVDFNVIDPVLGGEEGFEALSAALDQQGMGLLLDFVPNHMGIGPDNAWWQDVLAKGRASRFADFFDIDWSAGGGKLALPFLGAPLDELLDKRELHVDLDSEKEAPFLRYYDHRWPIAAGTLADDLATINQDRKKLRALIDRQAYRLLHWQDGPSQLNYRRFFEVDDLAALRMDRDEVFDVTHRLLLRLIAERKVQGVRLDHIDGLLDPLAYCRKLANAAADALGAPPPTQADMREGRPIFLLVEKILGHGEVLRDDLMAAGTTGYEFMTALAGLMVDPRAEKALAETKAIFGGENRSFNKIAREAKVEVLTSSFSGELDRLAAGLFDLASRHQPTATYRHEDCRDALIALIAAFPVYRTYVGKAGATADDRRWIESALETAPIAPPLSDLLRLLLVGEASPKSGITRDDALAFAMKLQLLTGPVMAKAVEDRAFYRDLRLVSLNDVGGEPAIVGGSIDDFHRWVETHQEQQPHGMLATATHDHKRGEEVRARLHVLSEMPDAWRAAALRWQAMHAGLVREVEGRRAPGADDEYLIYQTLLGIWPPDLKPSDRAGLAALSERLKTYLRKASREAAVRTSWTVVDQAYEEATAHFIDAILDVDNNASFLREVAAFADRLAFPGFINGLVQTVLKLTLPGVPDCYQGTETWDFSLVDPDNRRAVDFRMLAGRLDEPGRGMADRAGWTSGGIKQRLIRSLLRLRASAAEFFEQGDYRPIQVKGAKADHMLAFSRQDEQHCLVVAVPRLIAPFCGKAGMSLDWADTRLALPQPCDAMLWIDVLDGTEKNFGPGPDLSAVEIFSAWPVAVLIGTQKPQGS